MVNGDEWENHPSTTEKIKVSNYPVALKFTFTVYDRHNVIAGGRTFTHIVYLGD